MVNDCSVIDSGCNISDHFAINASLSCSVKFMPKAEVVSESVPKSNVLWIAKNIQLFNNSANNVLMRIQVPACCAPPCRGVCSDNMHREQLNAFSCDISWALSEAMDCCETDRVVHKVQ